MKRRSHRRRVEQRSSRRGAGAHDNVLWVNHALRPVCTACGGRAAWRMIVLIRPARGDRRVSLALPGAVCEADRKSRLVDALAQLGVARIQRAFGRGALTDWDWLGATLVFCSLPS